MKKLTVLKPSFYVVTILLAFVFGFGFSLNLESNQPKITFASKAEAGFWKDFEKDFRNARDREARATRREIIRDIEKNVRDFRKEQRNIARADGDPRFANKRLSDSEVRALRTLKSLPKGQESLLEVLSSEASAIKYMCRQLPEFSFVRNAYDQYGERIGIVVYRRN